MNWYKKANNQLMFSPELEEEIKFQMDNYNEDQTGEILTEDDKLTIGDAIQRLMQDMDDPDHQASRFKKELENFGISIGIYKPITKLQMDRTQILGRGKKYDFKRGSIYYVFDSWEPLNELV